MNNSPGGFRAALGIGWAALGAAGVLYVRARGIPVPAALPVIAAFLIAYPFYLVTGFPAMRERLAGPRLKWFLLAAALLPYLVCCCGAIEFHWYNVVRLAALALTISLWYVVLPSGTGLPAYQAHSTDRKNGASDRPGGLSHALADLLFLAIIPAVVLGGYFDSIYPPYMGQKLNVLGHVTFLPVVVLVLMLERRVRETGYGFAPTLREWRIGALHYLYFLPIGGSLAFLLHAVKPHEPAALWKIAATFLAFLWVIGLSEEFFFRGVLQQWIEDWTRNRAAALAIASVVFGLVHLGFRGFPFPNWRWALLAGVMGWFCGRARNQAGSIRASAVTHALVVATWRAFLG
ncbi:MAG: CPBP family intramembrane glutamic endopeptidase [Bryobacteraceae bacterium]